MIRPISRRVLALVLFAAAAAPARASEVYQISTISSLLSAGWASRTSFGTLQKPWHALRASTRSSERCIIQPVPHPASAEVSG